MPHAPRSAQTGWRLWDYAKTLRWSLIAATIAAVIASLAQPALVALLKDVLGVFSKPGGGFGDLARVLKWLIWLAITLGVLDGLQIFLFDRASQRLVERLRGDLFARLQKLSMSFFEDATTGMLMSRATNDINTIQLRLNYELTRLIQCPVRIAGLIAVMFWQAGPLAVVSFIVILAIVPPMTKANSLARRHSRAVQDRLADLSSRLQESIAAIRVVQCFGAGDYEVERFAVENANARRAMMRRVRVWAILLPLVEFVGMFGLMAVFYAGGYLVMIKHAIEPEKILTVLVGLLLITPNFKQLSRAKLAASELLAAAEKVFGVLDTPSEIVNLPGAVELPEVEGRVEFEQVGFHYKSGRQVLSDIDLRIEPGETLAVVGPSGAGKSTLVNLIPRLYDPTAGRVLVDGHDLRDLTLESLRAHIGIVLQETILFRGSIRDNIAYGRPEAPEDEIVAAAIAANADRFIRELAEGYETDVGERGKKLSGGQAQRVAIARAILRDPRILILDEATSSLDSESEALVQDALERLMARRTTVVIAHRLSTVQNADRIVFLSEGRILECGSHEELLALDGHYRRACAMQGGDHLA